MTDVAGDVAEVEAGSRRTHHGLRLRTSVDFHEHPWRNGRESQVGVLAVASYLFRIYFERRLARRAGSNPGAT